MFRSFNPSSENEDEDIQQKVIFIDECIFIQAYNLTKMYLDYGVNI